MKIIKYRVWDKKNKRMIYSNEYESIEFTKDNSCSIKLLSGDTVPNVIPMLFTQYIDAKNKEIYEDDIVQSKEKSGQRVFATVTYAKGAFCLGVEGGLPIGFKSSNEEVIGNKYENYDLFKLTT